MTRVNGRFFVPKFCFAPSAKNRIFLSPNLKINRKKMNVDVFLCEIAHGGLYNISVHVGAYSVGFGYMCVYM